MNDKCPFCGEPALFHGGKFKDATSARYRCGTQGPDINGEYDVGHVCDITIWTRVLTEKDAEIERLKHHPSWLCPDCRDKWNAAEANEQLENMTQVKNENTPPRS